MNKFILYVKKSCPFCAQAESLLVEREHDFTSVPFDSEPLVLEQMKQAYEQGTVPMVFHMRDRQIEFVGGYTDLVEYLDEQER